MRVCQMGVKGIFRRSDPSSMDICDPAGIQTQDLQNRNLMLYSAKLWDLCICLLGSKRMQRYKISFKSTTNLLFFIL